MHFKTFEAFLANLIFYPYPASGGGVLFDYSVNPVLPFEILNSQRVGIPSFHLWKVFWWGGVTRIQFSWCDLKFKTGVAGASLATPPCKIGGGSLACGQKSARGGLVPGAVVASFMCSCLFSLSLLFFKSIHSHSWITDMSNSKQPLLRLAEEIFWFERNWLSG